MIDLYMVVCNHLGHRVCKERFTDYDSSVEYAFEQNGKNGYSVLVLHLNNKNLKWERVLTLYPSETC